MSKKHNVSYGDLHSIIWMMLSISGIMCIVQWRHVLSEASYRKMFDRRKKMLNALNSRTSTPIVFRDEKLPNDEITHKHESRMILA